MDETKLDQWLESQPDADGTMAVGAQPVAGLFDVMRRLRALGVNWDKIFALIGPIIKIITEGGTFTEIMAKLIELFFPPQPGPGAIASAKAP